MVWVVGGNCFLGKHCYIIFMHFKQCFSHKVDKQLHEIVDSKVFLWTGAVIGNIGCQK